MVHLPKLIEDLALILMAAGLVTILFRRIKQPVVLGYIVAGFLIGPHFAFFPTITDLPNVQVWAEIGVIFLLFALGLEFSFRKLAKVGGEASITGITEVVGMTAIGYLAGLAFGWTQMDSLFLGGILAISSTTIIIRAFEELGVKSRGFVSLVFGVLIVEDLVAILLMVLLSTVAISKQFDGLQLSYAVLKLFFFLTVWFLVGIFVLPTFLKKIRKYSNNETLLIVAIGLCFLMVVMVSHAGFSPALGAFIMGSLLAETVDGEKIEHLISPVKDLFAAIFFVSVGMLIDPKVLVEYAGPIIALTLITIVGKFITIAIGALLAGRSLRHAVQSGMSLAQIGEFSFIIATLGLSLKVTSDFLYPIAVGVSALTTFTTPYLIKSADPLYNWLERVLPAKLREGVSQYSSSAKQVVRHAEWKEVVRAYLVRIVILSVVIAAIFLSLARVLPPILAQWFEDPRVVHAVGLGAALIASSPFFWALLMTRPKTDTLRKLWEQPEQRAAVLALEASRVGAAIALFGFLAPQFVALKVSVLITVGLAFAFSILFSRYLRVVYAWLERRFVSNLSAKESEEKEAAPALAPWDAHISKLEVPAESEVIGQTLSDLKVREGFGITIALIERGSRLITAPRGLERLYPHDRVAVIGTDEQIDAFRKAILASNASEVNSTIARYGLLPVRVTGASKVANKTIRESGLREQANGLVVGIERDGKRILNPDSTLSIEPGDLLWVVGEEEKIKSLS